MSTPTTLRAPGIAILCADGAVPAVGHTTWNQVARLGEFKGHPQGAFAFTPEVFAELIANFAETANGRVPVDYEHTSELLPDNAAQEGVPAVAWVVALDDRGPDGLWGAFEWVDAQAVEYVRARRYLYLSPAVHFDATHRESGEAIGARLTSVALTNHPFLDGMAPLTASEPAAHTLGLAPGAVHIPTGAVIAPPTEPAMSDEKTDNDAKKAMMGDAPPMGAPPAMMNPKLAAMAPGLGMGAEATEDMLLDKLAEVVAQLQATQQAEAATMADAVCASGRVPKEGRADLIALCLSDRTRFDRLFPAQTAAPDAPTGDVKTLLTERLSEPRQHPQPVAETDDSDPLAESKEAHALALKMLSDKRAPDYGTAIQMASREVRKHRTDAALSRLASATR